MTNQEKIAANKPSEDQIEDRLRFGLHNKWYCIAASSEITDKPVALKRLGQDIVVWRDGDGTVHVQEDYCPHRGAKFSLGLVYEGDLTCAYHGIQVNGDGVVTNVPAFTECHMTGEKLVRTYPSFEHYQGIFAWFGDDEAADPPAHVLPLEFTSPEWGGILHTDCWGGNYQYILDNLADPMHGSYLHAGTFTLGAGAKADRIKMTDTPAGFEVFREGQVDGNFDWLEVCDTDGYWIRVTIPYPAAGGPGGNLRIVCYVTPIDADNAQIYFWRMRKSEGWQRDMWRFLFRTKLVGFADHVLDQDKVAVANLPPWPARENLYQHDVGVVRLRKRMRDEAVAELATAANRPSAAEAAE